MTIPYASLNQNQLKVLWNYLTAGVTVIENGEIVPLKDEPFEELGEIESILPFVAGCDAIAPSVKISPRRLVFSGRTSYSKPTAIGTITSLIEAARGYINVGSMWFDIDLAPQQLDWGLGSIWTGFKVGTRIVQKGLMGKYIEYYGGPVVKGGKLKEHREYKICSEDLEVLINKLETAKSRAQITTGKELYAYFSQRLEFIKAIEKVA